MNPSATRRHRRSIRLPAFDYRSHGAYFITFCTRERRKLLARIVDDRSELSTIGQIALDEWRRTAELRPNVTLDEFIVTPNHVHGIIWLSRPAVVGAQRAAPLRSRSRQTFAVVPGSLGAIVRAFKPATTKRLNELNGTPAHQLWQRNYYERIIRDERELNRAREYIHANPQQWHDDPNNPARVRPDNH